MACYSNSAEKRKIRVRFKLRKASRKRLRLTVFRSNKHFYAQIIDDIRGISLVSASTLEIKEVGKNIEIAKQIGKKIAERALDIDIKSVYLDRGQRKYHGRIKAFAEGARESGLDF
ncbi:MAG: 50S ribosomal protein L18 [Proteobacteria bacterium]|nr:50S ribosomal protein L18 [Pseudomonadota bacterium]